MSISGRKKPIRLSQLKSDDPHLRQVLDRVHDILNGGIDQGGITPAVIGGSPAFNPGATSIPGNSNNVHVKAVFAVSDTDVTITHNLGRLPTCYKLASTNNPVQIYNGSVAPTTTQITLRGHLAGAAATTILEIY